MQFQEYPKWVRVEGSEHGGQVVFSREEEDALAPKEQEEPKRRGRPPKNKEAE